MTETGSELAGHPPMSEEEMGEVRESIEFMGTTVNRMEAVEGGCYVEDTMIPEGYVVRSGDWTVM